MTDENPTLKELRAGIMDALATVLALHPDLTENEARLTPKERRLAQEWADGRWLGDEWLQHLRRVLESEAHWREEANYGAYHGSVDLYVYFYELGLRLLRPGGFLSFIVTNKWLRAGYGEPLRQLFAEGAWVQEIVDLGHAKQVFPEADVFPSIILAQKSTTAPPPDSVYAAAIPSDELTVDDLTGQVCEFGRAWRSWSDRRSCWRCGAGRWRRCGW
jgi:hypothetical protein